MPNVFDVARYILRVCGPLSAMKLQKLVYYSQAWSLVWDDDPLFPEEIQAWANGPVVPDLYDIHRGLFKVEERFIPGEIENLSENQKETIDSVCDYYCKMNAQQLSDLTHHEQPSERLCVSRPTISTWETDKFLPGTSFIKAMASLFNCTTDELLNPPVTSGSRPSA